MLKEMSPVMSLSCICRCFASPTGQESVMQTEREADLEKEQAAADALL